MHNASQKPYLRRVSLTDFGRRANFLVTGLSYGAKFLYTTTFCKIFDDDVLMSRHTSS